MKTLANTLLYSNLLGQVNVFQCHQVRPAITD